MTRFRRGNTGGGGSGDWQVGVTVDDGYWRADAVNQFTTTADWIVIGRGAAAEIFDSFARFTSVDIPNGATIDIAYVTIEGKQSTIDGPGVKSNLYMEDSDDAVAPTTDAEASALTKTTAFTAWDDVDFGIDTPVNSPSIVDVVKEIVDRGSWASGNAMMIIWSDDTSDASKQYRPYDYSGDSSKAMKLHVEWSS